MIPGSPSLFELDSDMHKSKGCGCSEMRIHNTFANLLRMAAYVTNADFVLVDLGPSSSYLNKVDAT